MQPWTLCRANTLHLRNATIVFRHCVHYTKVQSYFSHSEIFVSKLCFPSDGWGHSCQPDIVTTSNACLWCTWVCWRISHWSSPQFHETNMTVLETEGVKRRRHNDRATVFQSGLGYWRHVILFPWIKCSFRFSKCMCQALGWNIVLREINSRFTESSTLLGRRCHGGGSWGKWKLRPVRSVIHHEKGEQIFFLQHDWAYKCPWKREHCTFGNRLWEPGV